MLQWGASQVQRIATQNNRKIIRTARIELMHGRERSLWGIGSIMGRCPLKLPNESREILKALPQTIAAYSSSSVVGLQMLSLNN